MTVDITGPPDASDSDGGQRGLKFAKASVPASPQLLLYDRLPNIIDVKAWMTGQTTTDAMRCFNLSLVSSLLLDTAGPMYK